MADDIFDDLDETPGSESDALLDVPDDLSTLSTRQLRALSNTLYTALDADFPPYGVKEKYGAVTEECRQRELQALGEVPAATPRTSLRNNSLRSRFELFENGVLAGSIAYIQRASRLTLKSTTMAADRDRQELESLLIRLALLNAHRRRLDIIPYCPRIQRFLDANPHFWSLVTDK